MGRPVLEAKGGVGVFSSVLMWIAIGVVTVTTALWLFASQQEAGLSVFAVGLVSAAASMLSGGLIGFIFGVPRMLTADNPGQRSDGSGTVVANTNLEQISDWLTKILVGVGLTQFGAIGNAANDLFGALAPAFGGAGTGKVFAGGLIIFSTAFGFVTGWLYTRLVLGAAMARADRKVAAEALNRLAESAERHGDDDSAMQLREQARDVLRGLAPISEAYDRARQSMPAGPSRTAEFDRLADRAKAIVRMGQYDPGSVKVALAEGTDGERIAALTIMEAHPEATYLDAATLAAVNPRSSNEQYRALVALKALLPEAGDDGRAGMRATMEGLAERVPGGTARGRVIAEILASLDQ